MFATLKQLSECIHSCRLCPRLVEYRENVPPRAIFKDQCYWRKPVAGFGDPLAWLFLIGLAPSPDGGNRTGRLFTGDPSARFLLKGLYQAGLANQPFSESRDDGLILQGCFMTASVKCTPPKHHPNPEEILNCRGYLVNELALLKNLKAVLALGQLGFKAYLNFAKSQGHTTKHITFSHGVKQMFEGLPTLYGCFHPSPQNTYTGKLTLDMFLSLLQRIKAENR